MLRTTMLVMQTKLGGPVGQAHRVEEPRQRRRLPGTGSVGFERTSGRDRGGFPSRPGPRGLMDTGMSILRRSSLLLVVGGGIAPAAASGQPVAAPEPK